MTGDAIFPGDVLVVDSAIEPGDDKIVVVWLGTDHCVKRLKLAGEMPVLLSSNPAYEPIYLHPGDDVRILGVVTFVIHKLR